MTTLVLTNRQWVKLLHRIRNEEGFAASMRWRLEENYGFTVRAHRGFDPLLNRWVDDTRLDFKDPACLTFFQLKWMNNDNERIPDILV